MGHNQAESRWRAPAESCGKGLTSGLFPQWGAGLRRALKNGVTPELGKVGSHHHPRPEGNGEGEEGGGVPVRTCCALAKGHSEPVVTLQGCEWEKSSEGMEPVHAASH